MKTRIVLVAIAAMCFFCTTKVVAQQQIGTKDEVPMWSLPNFASIDSGISKVHLALGKLPMTNNVIHYRSPVCDIDYWNDESRGFSIYLYAEKALCTIKFSSSTKSSSWKISTREQGIEYDTDGKSRPCLVSEKTPDVKFFTGTLASLEAALNGVKK